MNGLFLRLFRLKNLFVHIYSKKNSNAVCIIKQFSASKWESSDCKCSTVLSFVFIYFIYNFKYIDLYILESRQYLKHFLKFLAKNRNIFVASL